MEISLSVHDNVSVSPDTANSTPANAGIALVRAVATRLTSAKASVSSWRSTRNFTTVASLVGGGYNDQMYES